MTRGGTPECEEKVTHTPGPWRVECGTLIVAGDVSLTRTAEAYSELKDGARFWETRANARLMAAAPELLAALEQAVEWAALNKQRAGTLDVDAMKAAIAKATEHEQHDYRSDPVNQPENIR